MAQKSGEVFAHGDEIRMFLRGRNHVVESWLIENGPRVNLGPVSPDTLSKALRGLPVLEPLPSALTLMLDEMRADPWAWCEPTERIEDVEGLQEYASYRWWYDLLRPTVPFSRFERMPKHPLPADELEFLQERLSEWRSRLRATCDQHEANHALARALQSDETPEYQHWVQEDTGWRLVGSGGQKYRVGNPGLRGRSADEIGLAYALADTSLPLPLIAEARLAYQMPEAWAVDDHVSEPVEPWNGDTFEGVEWVEWTDKRGDAWGLGTILVENKVLYCWDGERYSIADLPDGVGRAVRLRQRTGEYGDGYRWLPWRATTFRERDLIKFEVAREHDTEEELLSVRDRMIAEIWEGQKESWVENSPYSPFNQKAYPEGIPESEAIAQFEVNLERARANPKVRDEQAEIARRKMRFRRTLRRLP